MLHGRRVGGWVVEDWVAPDEGVVPVPLAASSGHGPPPEVVALADWAAWRWAGPVASFLATASPHRVVEAAPGPAVTPEPADDRPRVSPGGGAVGLVDAVLESAPVPAVVRLAPAYDTARIVLELVDRLGTHGIVVLAPEHARVDELADRLIAAGLPVAVLPGAWERAAAGGAVVVGTRSAAWCPVVGLRGAVVLDAHDEAYREQRAPTWSAVDVVLERARRDGAPVALVTPCPTVVLSEGTRMVTTGRELERQGWPVVEPVDRRGADPRTGLFSERLVHAARTLLGQSEGRVVCVLNRTGRVRLLACGECGTLARCTVCGGALAQPVRDGALHCPRCGGERPAICARCDSTRLRSVRMGVSRATEELSALLGLEALEVSATTDPVDARRARLVVGTEAALHRSGRVGLVAFLDFDQHLLAPRFSASEEAFALLARAARLTGGRGSGGRILVQTRLPDHEVLAAAVHADPSLLLDAERAVRRAIDLPPFGALATLRGPGAAELVDRVRAVGGPTVSELEEDRWLLRAADHHVLCDALAAVGRPEGRVRVEVDPVDV